MHILRTYHAYIVCIDIVYTNNKLIQSKEKSIDKLKSIIPKFRYTQFPYIIHYQKINNEKKKTRKYNKKKHYSKYDPECF